MSKQAKCPKCGAARKPYDACHVTGCVEIDPATGDMGWVGCDAQFTCRSWLRSDGELSQSDECKLAERDNRIRELEAEIQDAKALAYNTMWDRTAEGIEADQKDDLCEQLYLQNQRNLAMYERIKAENTQLLAIIGECHYCDAGFPRETGTHIPTQALGMIPLTQCSRLDGRLESAEADFARTNDDLCHANEAKGLLEQALQKEADALTLAKAENSTLTERVALWKAQNETHCALLDVRTHERDALRTRVEELERETTTLTNVCGEISDKAVPIIRTYEDIREPWVGWMNEISGMAFRAWKTSRCRTQAAEESAGGE